YQLAPSAMALGYAALANLGVRHLSEPYREEMMRETGGAWAVGGRDRQSMIYFGQSRNGLTLGVQLDVGSRIPIATTAMGRAYIWALPPGEPDALLRALGAHHERRVCTGPGRKRGAARTRGARGQRAPGQPPRALRFGNTGGQMAGRCACRR